MSVESYNHPSDLSLDLLGIGDLGEGDSLRAIQHIDSCSSCRERYETLRQDAEYFERHIYPRGLTEKPPASDGNTGEEDGRRTRLRWIPPAVIAAVAAVALFWINQAPSSRKREVVLAQKGSSTLAAFVRRGPLVFELKDGAHLQAGDAIRFVADPGRFSFLLVASIDAGGHATIYLPYQGQRSVRIQPNRRFEGDGSIILDATPGPERIFALFSSSPVEGRDVIAALRTVGDHGPDNIRNAIRLDVPSEFQTSIEFEK